MTIVTDGGFQSDDWTGGFTSPDQRPANDADLGDRSVF